MAKVAEQVAEKGIKAFLKSPKLWTGVGATALPLAMDYRMNDDPNAIFGVTTIKDLVKGNLGKDRAFNLAVNALLGGLSGKLTASGETVKGISTAALAPAKDLLFSSQELPSIAKDTAKKLTENADTNLKLLEETARNSKMNTALLGALGVGALGLGGLGIYKYLTSKKEKEGAKIKLRLPGKKGDPDSAAMVELPINMPEFSPALTEGLDRAVRLRTRKNIRANSMKRDPQTGKLIPYDEWKEKYGNGATGAAGAPTGGAFPEALDKAAASRETHERFGEILTTLGTTLASHYLGDKYFKGKNKELFQFLGDLAGGSMLSLLGRAAAAISGNRSVEEQEEHDSGTPLLEYLIPGYAAYQAEKRDRAEEDEKHRQQLQAVQTQTMLNAAISAIPGQAQAVTAPGALGSVDNPLPKGGIPDGEDDSLEGDDVEVTGGAPQPALSMDDDDDWEEKDAAAGPPSPGPPPGGGGPGGPKPTPGGASRPVPPDRNAPAKGIDSSTVTTLRAVQNQAQDAERKMAEHEQNQVNKQEFATRPATQAASLADIPNVLGEFRERLNNLA